MFRKSDSWFLTKMDKLILWLWNRYEIKKIELERLAFVIWQVAAFIDLILSNAHFSAWAGNIFFLAILVLIMLAREERAKKSPSAQNIMIAHIRNSPTGFWLRIIVYFMTVIVVGFAIPLQMLLNKKLGSDVVESCRWIAWFAFMILPDAYVPQEPPRRKARQKAKLPASAQPILSPTRL